MPKNGAAPIMSAAQKSKNHTKSPVLPLKSPSSSNLLYLTWRGVLLFGVRCKVRWGQQQRAKDAFYKQNPIPAGGEGATRV